MNGKNESVFENGKELYCNEVHLKIDVFNILPNPVETLQDGDHHIFGLAVLDDHE